LAENFLGGGQRKKRPKIRKKYRKITLFASSRGGGGERKKKNKKKQKKAEKTHMHILASIYYIHTMFENPGGPWAPPAPHCRRPCLSYMSFEEISHAKARCLWLVHT